MATFATLGLVALGSEFQQRVQYAMSVAAMNVYSEDPTTAGHAARASYAVKVMAGQFNIVPACYGVLANSTIAAEATLPVSLTQLTNASTAAANNVLHFAAVSSAVVANMVVTDNTNTASIIANTLVVSTNATSVTISQNAVGSGVVLGDSILFAAKANGNGIPDSDIQFAVNSIWNVLAWA